MYRENNIGVIATKTDTGFTFTGVSGNTYTVTVEDDLIVKVLYDGLDDGGEATSVLSYDVSKMQQDLIRTAHTPSGN